MAMKHRESIEAVKAAADKITLKRIEEDRERQAEAEAAEAAEQQEATNKTKTVEKK